MDDHADGTITALAGGDHVPIQPPAGRVVRCIRERSQPLEVSCA
ncbi:MAG TPA: hypothetical protein VNK41_01600 [Vicinamibacterales bacterium]|nr:hypothetical protein [Vicinamibacterales bacterium]